MSHSKGKHLSLAMHLINSAALDTNDDEKGLEFQKELRESDETSISSSDERNCIPITFPEYSNDSSNLFPLRYHFLPNFKFKTTKISSTDSKLEDPWESTVSNCNIISDDCAHYNADIELSELSEPEPQNSSAFTSSSTEVNPREKEIRINSNSLPTNIDPTAHHFLIMSPSVTCVMCGANCLSSCSSCSEYFGVSLGMCVKCFFDSHFVRMLLLLKDPKFIAYLETVRKRAGLLLPFPYHLVPKVEELIASEEGTGTATSSDVQFVYTYNHKPTEMTTISTEYSATDVTWTPQMINYLVSLYNAEEGENERLHSQGWGLILQNMKESFPEVAQSLTLSMCQGKMYYEKQKKRSANQIKSGEKTTSMLNDSMI